ncbi:hypothetical protein BDY21DRAFT_413397 [Lineolata rhizophorae]|uniref:Uncharacterized protein n=1 Tax=Lineolata rhizophorae TaxID=578093 RepID=A0A6A6P8U5_9PEZI|nr:hypothetical protein BDY21DRAFT_413397 [Lineolata rhizophorae]
MQRGLRPLWRAAANTATATPTTSRDWVAAGQHAALPVFLCPALATTRHCGRTGRVTPLTRPTRRFATARAAAAPREHEDEARDVDPLETFPHVEEPESAALAESSAGSSGGVGGSGREEGSGGSGETGESTRRVLPPSCPGCGAPTQSVAPDEAGYYNLRRAAVRNWLRPERRQAREAEDEKFASALGNADDGLLAKMGLDRESVKDNPAPPPCDRCHALLHHGSAAQTPIYHPTMSSLRAVLSSSPWRRNHIYHVVDAADFPLSLIPDLTSHLDRVARLRGQNRRSKSVRWNRGRPVDEVSFVITRADLLVPKKEMLDKLMPWVSEVLRDALGRSGRRVRLGDVRCVSAHRGWWTREVKEKVWERGGGGWLVGRVNVGKSRLFEVVFPKGRSDGAAVDFDRLRGDAEREAALADPDGDALAPQLQQQESNESDFFPLSANPSSSLLPPAPSETPYPPMPTVSPLPGTTASPIRLPFGRGRGELVDLPGLARPSLADCIARPYKEDLVMTSRVAAPRTAIKGGQSLLLGGPLDGRPPDMWAHAFVPPRLGPHVTATPKAVAVQAGRRALPPRVFPPDAVPPHVAAAARKARTVPLRWDVTRAQAGPLTSKAALRLKPARLPFVVWAADVLVEGVGWVEVGCQVRRRWVEDGLREAERRVRANLEAGEGVEKLADEEREGGGGGGETVAFKPAAAAKSEGEEDGWLAAAEAPDEAILPEGVSEEDFKEMVVEEAERMGVYPEVDVFTPEGKFIGVRRPMGGSIIAAPKKNPKTSKKRPRLSMKAVKARRRPKGE